MCEKVVTDNYTISLPVTDQLLLGERTEVKQDSPLHERELVEQFARYFKNEMHFDFIQFEASETAEHSWYVPYSAWLFHETARDQLEEESEPPQRIYGACCFRWREWENHEPTWQMDWLWLHPYFRGKGILNSHWQFFRGSMAPFVLSQPLSPGMERFLKKHGHESLEIT